MPDDNGPLISAHSASLPADFVSPNNMGLAIWFDDHLFKRATHIADYLSRAQGIVPAHLLGKREACFFVVEKALTWKLSPSAVAGATYQTPGGKVGYEGKLCQAILEASGRLEGGVNYEFYGDWSRIQGKFRKQTSSKGNDFWVPDWKQEHEIGVGVRVKAQVKGEAEPRVLEFDLMQAQPRNSTLWALDPKTQICYTAVRRFSSVAVPSLMMGVPFDRDDWSETQIRDITPDRPTRADAFSSATAEEERVTDVEEGDGKEEKIDPYIFVNGDAEEEDIADGAEWGSRFHVALTEAPNRQIAMGLWDSNSSQLQRFRDEVENGGKLADTIEEAYGEAIKRREPAPASTSAADAPVSEQQKSRQDDPKLTTRQDRAEQEQSQQKDVDPRPHAPKHLGKVPRSDKTNSFDWAKAAKDLGDAIEKSDNLEDVRLWQELHMNWIDSIQKNDEAAYGNLNRRISATTEILSGVQE